MGAQILRARFFAPPAPLAGCFTSFYLLEVEPAGGGRVEDYLHPEWANLRFFLGPSPSSEVVGCETLSDTPFTATGPTSCPVRFRLPATRMWGVGLLPLGWAKFIGVPASSLANRLNDGLRHPAYSAFVPLYHALRQAPASDEAQAAIECARAAHRVSRDAFWIAHADAAWRWFFGANDRGAVLADLASGRCRDGVNPRGRNENCGAESILALHLARHSMLALHADKADDSTGDLREPQHRPDARPQARPQAIPRGRPAADPVSYS